MHQSHDLTSWLIGQTPQLSKLAPGLKPTRFAQDKFFKQGCGSLGISQFKLHQLGSRPNLLEALGIGFSAFGFVQQQLNPVLEAPTSRINLVQEGSGAWVIWPGFHTTLEPLLGLVGATPRKIQVGQTQIQRVAFLRL